MALEVGELAPDFTLPDQNGNDFRFSELRGRNVLLAFYRHDFSPVWTAEFRRIHDYLPEIRELGAQVVGISADSHWSHKVFAEQEDIDFPLLSDWFGNVGRLFGVWSEEKQRELRTVYVIDSAGVISYKQSYSDDELPDFEPPMEVLRKLQEQEEKLAG